MADQSDRVIKSTSRLLVQHARDAYQHEAEDWRDIDRKAQGVVAICGIFLTAATLSLRNLVSFTVVGHLALFVLVVTVLIAAWQAISALKVAKIKHGVEPTSEVIYHAKEVFEAAPNDDDGAQQRIRDFVLDRAEEWSKARDALFVVNDRKAGLISSAQDCLSWSLPVIYVIVADAVIKGIVESTVLRLLFWGGSLYALYLIHKHDGEAPAA